MAIHPTAIVDSKAELADDVDIQPFSIIGPHVTIGQGTVVGSHSTIEGRTVIGKRNKIFSCAQIGVISQDMKHDLAYTGRTELGDDNIVREHVTISASTMSGPEDEDRVTSVGNECLFMANSHVAHDCHVGNQVWMANCASLAGHVDIEDFAIIGGLTGIHQECVVGTMAFVGGMARVSQDVPPYMIVEGNPSRCRGPNALGLRRRGLDEAARTRIKNMYKIMYRTGQNVTAALHEIERQIDDSPERSTFVEFYRKSMRGVTR
jgi:UDP-N-acetylglucosamine acyltransferase